MPAATDRRVDMRLSRRPSPQSRPARVRRHPRSTSAATGWGLPHLWLYGRPPQPQPTFTCDRGREAPCPNPHTV